MPNVFDTTLGLGMRLLQDIENATEGPLVNAKLEPMDIFKRNKSSSQTREQFEHLLGACQRK